MTDIPRVALVHDFLLDVRGAERVFLELCEIWPQGDIFTTVYDEQGTEGRFAQRNVTSSFLQRLRPSSRTFRTLLPLYPAAIESFDLSGYGLVVSSSSAWAHAVPCGDEAVHVSYCHNPFRYAWSERDATLASRDPVSRAVLRMLFDRWRRWDRAAARRPTRYIANSAITQQRIRRYFDRESDIVHPPVNTARFEPGPVGDHYAIVSELMSHKQIGVAIEAFNRLRRPLVIIGDGPAARRLQRLAGPTVRLLGRVSDGVVERTLQSARALIVTAVEEFGISAVEAQAAGRPVIARAAGGALETVVDGETGRLWSGGPDELARAVLEFDDAAIDPDACRLQAERFSRERFRERMLAEARAALDRPAPSPTPWPEPAPTAAVTSNDHR
ncbi:MAG TPA: glycosyltransferase [Solirubrobacteraceae bacterium]|nr:glycosyltransferase [Solirubrobacteraceae bacterium]